VVGGEGATTRAGAAGVLMAPAPVLLPEQDVESLSYLNDPDPPLTGDDAAWARSFLSSPPAETEVRPSA